MLHFLQEGHSGKCDAQFERFYFENSMHEIADFLCFQILGSVWSLGQIERHFACWTHQVAIDLAERQCELVYNIHCSQNLVKLPHQ